MVGVGLTVGGWFVTSIIRNVINTISSSLGDNYALLKGTEEMLKSLQDSLPPIQAVIEVASKSPTTNMGLITWLDNLENAAYEVKDVLDDIEAKTIRESLKRKDKVTKIISSSGKFVKTLIFSDKELVKFKSAVDKFSKISSEGERLLNVLGHDRRASANIEHTYSRRRKTSYYLDPNAKIFGRDIEIYFILDMILNYQLMCFSEGSSNEKPESQSELHNLREVKGTSSSWGNRTMVEKFQRAFAKFSDLSLGITRYEEENPSEVKREGKSQEGSNIKSSVGEQNSVCIRNWKLPILPIYGIRGVGKTTIAKMVYNNNIVKDYCFDRRAWVYVSENSDEMEIMNKIVRKLGGDSGINSNMDFDTIESKLIETIKNRRFFLVLDDVHDKIKSKLSIIFSVLGNGAPGSLVLVTTQSESLAKTIQNMSCIISLGVLEPEWFDLLFQYYAFGEFFDFDPRSGTSSISCTNNFARARFLNLNEDILSALKPIATEIAKKLHGLPLAGQVIGNMLHEKLIIADRKENLFREWNDILHNDWWDDENASNDILPLLEIGYNDLDDELKQCFAFCSIFPTHYLFDRSTLVQMWMAHDFVKPNVQEKLKMDIGKIKFEDVGRKRFDNLVERAFFQATIRDGKYVMHDLIRELAIAVATKEFYYVKSMKNHIPSVARHLAIDCDGSKLEKINIDNTNLRTLLLFDNWENCSDESISSIFAKSTGLRLLDLSYIGMKIKRNVSIIEAICQLSHLRFVDLSFSGITSIPDKFCKLCHLQVLDVRGCNLKLPRGMNNLIKLRYLYASVETVSEISGIGKLTNLQELEKFHVGSNAGYKITELRDMNQLSGQLLLSGLQNISSKEEASGSQLDKKMYLNSLQLKFEYVKYQPPLWSELQVLEAIKPSSSVETVTFNGLRGRYLPSWISNLKCIQVKSSDLTTLPAFGDLLHLEMLSLDDLRQVTRIGDEFFGSSEVAFPSLKELTFSNMSSWCAWSDTGAGKKSFLRLKKICLRNCPNLMEMPTNCFTSWIIELELLELLECPNIHNIETILEMMPRLTHLTLKKCCTDLSIDCRRLSNLEVACISDVERLDFTPLVWLKKLRKLEIMGFDKISTNLMLPFELIEESDETSEENDETSEENRILALHLYHSDRSTQSLPIAGWFTYLRSLLIRNSPVTEYADEEESSFSQLTSLQTLEFSNSPQLRLLPSTLPSLIKLKKLTIENCPMICSLPEPSLPQNLTELYITGCSNELVHRCQPNQGDEWCKIFHILHVRIK